MTTYKVHAVTAQRVTTIKRTALEDLAREERSTRPQCATCGSFGPTIDQRCALHLALPTLCYLDTVSAEDVETFSLLSPNSRR